MPIPLLHWLDLKIVRFCDGPRRLERAFQGTGINALDLETGELLWDFRRYSESAGVLANPSPAVLGPTVVVPQLTSRT